MADTKASAETNASSLADADGWAIVQGGNDRFAISSQMWTYIQSKGAAVTSGHLGQFAATTSAQLATVISDETGSGALVFASAPTLTNPVVGTQSANDNSTKAASTAYADAVKPVEAILLACSDETTPLTSGNGKLTFRMHYAFTLTAVRASLTTAQATSGGGGIVTVDINEAGTTILSTKITIDNTEKTSTSAATAAVISDASLADDAEITIDIDQVGDGTATGLKVTLIGKRT